MNGFGSFLKAVPAANQPSIFSNRFNLAVSKAVLFAPCFAFVHLFLEAVIAQVLAGKPDAIDGEWSCLTAGIIDPAFFEAEGGDNFQYCVRHILIYSAE